jgi:hypothetical protein
MGFHHLVPQYEKLVINGVCFQIVCRKVARSQRASLAFVTLYNVPQPARYNLGANPLGMTQLILGVDEA